MECGGAWHCGFHGIIIKHRGRSAHGDGVGGGGGGVGGGGGWAVNVVKKQSGEEGHERCAFTLPSG